MSNLTYPSELAIAPLAKPVYATVTVPGSKSITNRALVLAALTRADKVAFAEALTAAKSGSVQFDDLDKVVTRCALVGVLRSEDTEVMLDCLRKLGFGIKLYWKMHAVVVSNYTQRPVPWADADLYVGNSGTTVRFLTAMLSLGTGRYRLDGVPRMRERPIQDLLDALAQLGVRAASETGNGCPPVVIEPTGRWPGGVVSVRGSVSSQFLSGLLLVAPFAGVETEFRTEGALVSEPYIQMTVRMLRDWKCDVEQTNRGYRVRPRPADVVGPAEYHIEPDASAASYFWAAAAVAGGRVTVSGLTRASLQGDVRFVDVLAQMGCRVEECEAGITVHGGPLRGVDVDMNDISDTVMTLGAVALFADGPSTIRNVAHIRHKETDRIAALATELRKLGAEVEERADGLTITPRPLTGCAVDTYNDHRMAMSLALVGLKVPGVVVRNPGCVAKTYPGFWQDLDALT
ncbi:MAG: 3-phosphoshikimate 1-carboxyvinyltransferase [Planctomycetes bacterium]|nr:3-phosphoshikimate 1-carboxyvinyltransferase [Planctomycetota bacterium]